MKENVEKYSLIIFHLKNATELLKRRKEKSVLKSVENFKKVAN